MFDRGWWVGIVVFLIILLAGSLSALGIHTLHTSPRLFFDPAFLLLSESHLRSIARLPVDRVFFLRFPEFFTAAAEEQWWQKHEKVYNRVRGEEMVEIEVTEGDERARTLQARVGAAPLVEVITSTWLIYIVALIYLLNAFSVFQRYRSPPGVILAFFFLACSFYFLSAAPIVRRSLTLPPFFFRTFIDILYASAGGMITLVHFALVFPRPKSLLARYPWIPYCLYGYLLLTTTLYLSGVTAFGATFPFFCFWVLVLIGALLHSLVRERDPFLRKQIRLSLTAPLLVSLLFILFYLLPGVLRRTPIDFTYFALFSLILPFALPLAMDNLSLYQARLAADRDARRERERVRADLHDLSLGSLARIARLAESTQLSLTAEPERARERLQSIEDIATGTAQELRGIFQVTDERHSTWEDLCGYLRECGYKITEAQEIDFRLDDAPALHALPLPSPQLRECLYLIYMEALENVIKHSGATRVSVLLSRHDDALVCEIADDGAGFDPQKAAAGHYGLSTMKRRAEDLGESLTITTGTNAGVRLRFQLPVRKSPN